MLLYSFAQSSGAYRVRIALALKGIEVDMEYVNLRKNEHLEETYAKINPQRMIPSFVDGEHTLTQSLAIIEYLDETHPLPALLPDTPLARARVRAIAQAMACDIAPLNNLQVRKYVKSRFSATEEEWIQHWTEVGLTAVEKMLATNPHTGTYCHGELPTLADCCLVPQLFHARRFGCDLSAYPTLIRIDVACNALPAFQKAHPDNQKDAV